MEGTTKVGIYARLSRDDERFGESMSIENQKLMLTDYCDRQGWEIIDVYADDGFTGLTFDRPEMQRLIEDAKNGRINTVLVKDLSRFGRNYVEVGQLIDDLFPLLNIRLVAPNDGVDTHTNQNTDFIPIRNVFNEYYCKDISRKVISARKASAKQGNFMGSSAPYGYWFDPNDRHKLIIDEDAAVVVQRIFRMRADDCSYNQIADTLNREGIPNPRDYYYHKIGKPNPRVMRHYWSEITITHILKNEVYIGNMVQFKSGVVSYKNHSIRAKPEETWIDETAAEIVRYIFRLRLEGKSCCRIAAILNEQQIVPPRDYYYQKRNKPNPRNVHHRWTDGSVCQMLKNEVYIGNTVQYKTEAPSYKCRKQIPQKPEQWVRCDNTHEPIICREDWDAVQSLWKQTTAKKIRIQSAVHRLTEMR